MKKVLWKYYACLLFRFTYYYFILNITMSNSKKKEGSQSFQTPARNQVTSSEDASSSRSQYLSALLESNREKDVEIERLKKELNQIRLKSIQSVNDAKNSDMAKKVTTLCDGVMKIGPENQRKSRLIKQSYDKQLKKLQTDFEKQMSQEKEQWAGKLKMKEKETEGLKESLKNKESQLNKQNISNRGYEQSKVAQKTIIDTLKMQLEKSRTDYKSLLALTSASRQADEEYMKEMRSTIKRLSEDIKNLKGGASQEELQRAKKNKEEEAKSLNQQIDRFKSQLTAIGKRSNEVILKVQEIIEACLSSSSSNPPQAKWNTLKNDFDKWRGKKDFPVEWEKQALNFVKSSLSFLVQRANLLLSENQRATASLNDRQKMLSERQTKITQLQASLADAKKINIDKDEAIRKLSDSIKVYNLQKANLQSQIEIKSKELIKKVQEFKKLDDKCKSAENELINTKAVLEIDSKDLATQKAKVKDHVATIALRDSELAKNRRDIEDLRKEIDAKKTEIATLDKAKTDLTNSLKLKQGELKGKIGDLNKLTADLKTEKQSKKLLEDDLKSQIKALEGNKNQLTANITSISRNLNAETAEKKKIQINLQATNQSNVSLSRQLEDVRGLLKKSEERTKHLDSDLTASRKCVVGVVKGLSLAFTGREEELDVRSNDFADSLDRKKEQFVQIFNRTRFFNGSVIVAPEKIDFIVKSLENYSEIRSKCRSSTLIYRYDPLNPTNFHKYFDGKERLISFVKLTNGTVIGGFTIYPYEQEKNEAIGRGKGFLFSITLEKVFKQKIDARQGVTTYDNFYYIFGNAEIRIRTQEKKVFSNFGIATSTFDAERVSRAEFLGVRDNSNNEVDIESYEFYQMEFSRE